jgi:cyclic pyranopterin phosphate synthase
MRDTHGRSINYLRLSITDRCNLRCCYCMPEEGVEQCGHDDILRYEELLQIARVAVSLGIEKVRVTGGEPLVRKGVISFLEQLCAIPGLNEVALTTNGLRLEEFAPQLKAAGIDRLNISIDSLRAETFSEITRGGDLAKVKAGLVAAERTGLHLKLNMVVMRGINDAEVEDFASPTLNHPWSVRFIEYMPTIREESWKTRVIPGAEILERLQQRFKLTPLQSSRLCGPARPYRIEKAQGTIGIITPMSDHFCGSCNRIRVASNGTAKSCLLSDQTNDLKPFLGQGQDGALREALIQVINGKIAKHHLEDEEGGPKPFNMASIGG